MKRFKTIKPTVKVKYRYGGRTEVSHVDLEDEVGGLTHGREENDINNEQQVRVAFQTFLTIQVIL
jgi:hypothetical protein